MKEVVIDLIKADIIHSQLLGGLERIHFKTDMYFLNLYKPIAQLMSIQGDIPEQWLAIYDYFLENAHQHEVSNEEESLLSIAEECYNMLNACINIDNHLNKQEKP